VFSPDSISIFQCYGGGAKSWQPSETNFGLPMEPGTLHTFGMSHARSKAHQKVFLVGRGGDSISLTPQGIIASNRGSSYSWINLNVKKIGYFKFEKQVSS